MSKYDPLRELLAQEPGESIRLSFDEIEEIISASLPESARRYPAWWANDATAGRQAHAWLSAGWKTAQVDLAGKRVTFMRGGFVPPASARPVQTAHPPKQEVPRFDDLPDAPEGDVELSVQMQWKRLGAIRLDVGGALAFPPVPQLPGLYRFRLNGASAQRYVGETMDLRRRFQHYRAPGPTQATNLRINEILRTHLAAGGAIEVDIFTGPVSVRIGQETSVLDLADKSARRLLEHAALVADGATDIESLNR